MEFSSTEEIPIADDPLDMIIGQDKAVEIARLAVAQKRHVLLVGPPGTGKSMIAKAMAYRLEKPREEIVVLHNPRNPERPNILTRNHDELQKDGSVERLAKGKVKKPSEIPKVVAERMGFLCSRCGKYSQSDDDVCPHCFERKIPEESNNAFTDLISQVFSVNVYDYPEEEVHVSRFDEAGNEEIIIYQNLDNDKVRVMDSEALENLNKLEMKKRSKVLVPLKRNAFVQATGSSETELLGDVKHDPWGGMAEAGGLPPYQRVVAGAIHEAHEGILFIDELPQLGRLQHHILTAMQEKHFPISGMNPTSSGAAVKVNKVPCDFIFVGACNIADLEHVLSPLRSRVVGSGYEVLLETTMPRTPENEEKIAKFFAQEVRIDKKIPHGDASAVKELIEVASARAKEMDNENNSLSLRLRDLGGVIRVAGDLAKMENAELISGEHIKRAVKSSKSVEQQLVDRYGSLWHGKSKDNISQNLMSEEKKARGYL